MISSGDVFSDRYKVVKHVAQGGMQTVFEARDAILQTTVALKTPLPGQADRRFKDSARISAKINHHNVAKTLDYFEQDNVVYLIEEFVHGETLDKKLDRLGLLDPNMGAWVLYQLAKGISASHHAGVIHRDLKPSNVIVSDGIRFNLLKITDFGVATLTQEVFDEALEEGDITLSKSGTVKGAIPYMAPEMMFRRPGEPSDMPIDIWSLGAMMFKLLTGEFPFGVFLEAAVNVKSNNRKPWPAFMTKNAQFAPLAQELQEIVNSCLQQDPNARPTADSLVQQCENLCYLVAPRKQGKVYKLFQNGYSAFATAEKSDDVFLSMKSVYGKKKPKVGSIICFSDFVGHPRNRAHPVLVIG